MPEQSGFPHLNLILRERFAAKFSRGVRPNEEIKRNQEDRPTHVGKLRGSLVKIRDLFRLELERRHREGLPAVPAGAGFVMRIPDGEDPDAFAHALGVELVAESEGGFMLVASEDLSFQRLEEIISKFERGSAGGGATAALLDVFESPDASHRLERVLTPDVLKLWPFTDEQDYIFDISVQTAEGTRSYAIDRVVKRKTESEDEFQARRDRSRRNARAAADENWIQAAEERFDLLAGLVSFYRGEMLTGVVADEPKDFATAIRFSDSFQVRARVNGKGWMDIIKNLPNIFEVSIPEDVEQPLPPHGVGELDGVPEVDQPDAEAPAVCVVDSGIQEGHIWLESALDAETSRCFLPGSDPEDVQDEVRPSGHGTRVAGAVLYPREVPKSGPVKPIAWLQNARVLNGENQIPENLPPAKYVEGVVAHFKATPKKTRLFNHSVAGNVPCTLCRMSAWATKIDELAHREDVLFFQAAGNLPANEGRPGNPCILHQLQSGKPYPAYLEEPFARIANPAQSLQALTVGSVAADVWSGHDKRSICRNDNAPSSFSRSGFGIWNAVKPEVVEIGGDYAIAEAATTLTVEEETAVELIRTAGDGGPAVAKDDVGTSYAAPKVAHLGAILQRAFPDAPTLLYRGLIVHSARWPGWMNGGDWNADRNLRLVGFGMPSRERATENAPHRVTLITPNAITIHNQELHLYRVRIPVELRARAQDVPLRLEVTLSYSSEPRRTRSSRRGYLATWLDWRSSGLGEPFEIFKQRMVSGEEAPLRRYPQPDWCLHYSAQHGEANETHRGNGTIQKDWAKLRAHDLGEEVFIAVRAHKGWDHRAWAGGAKYCLIVSIEAEDLTIPVYATMASVNVEVETPLSLSIPAKEVRV